MTKFNRFLLVNFFFFLEKLRVSDKLDIVIIEDVEKCYNFYLKRFFVRILV